MRARVVLIATLLLLGCGEFTGPSRPEGFVSLPAGVTITRAFIFDLRVFVTLENNGPAADVSYDACAFAVRGYDYDGDRRWSRLLPDSANCRRPGDKVQVPANGTVHHLIGSIAAGLFSGPDHIRNIGSMDMAYRTRGAPSLKVVEVLEAIE